MDTAKDAETELINAAIVTFKTLRDARIASQVLWQAKPYNTFVEPAPEPNDIIWANLTNSVLNQYVIVCLFFISEQFYNCSSIFVNHACDKTRRRRLKLFFLRF